MRSALDQAVWVRATGWSAALCSRARHFTLLILPYLEKPAILDRQLRNTFHMDEIESNAYAKPLKIIEKRALTVVQLKP